MNDKIVTRFAPSPTGPFHIGSVRTALFNVLFTKKAGGTFVLRIDDTDKERSRPEYEKDIHDSLTWLNLLPDKTYHQSKRSDIYREKLEKLLATDFAYWSDETPTEGGRDRVIRFRNPNKRVTFHDLIRGQIEFDTTDLGNFVLAKDLDTPLYHFASVVDDHELEITHIIRGEDHISNTPRQILIAESIGATIPEYGHIPLILAPDKTKLSKRKHGDLVAISNYRQAGYLPEALINFVALLGWSPQAGKEGTDKEIFTIDELIEKFDLSAIQKGGAVFNLEKLKWTNREHIKRLPKQIVDDKLAEVFFELEEETRNWLFDPIIDRIHSWADLDQLKEEWTYLWQKPKIEKGLVGDTRYLGELKAILLTVKKNEWNPTNLKETIWDFATEKGRSQVLGPWRLALTGQQKSLDPFTVAAVIGQEEALRRLDHVMDL